MFTTTLLNFPSKPELTPTPEFYRKVVDIADRLGMDPDALDAIMYSESGFDPHVVNKIGASGLIQILPQYAHLFTRDGRPLTIEEIRAMSAVEQLDLVEQRYAMLRGKLHRPADYFIANIWPVGLGKPDSYVLGRQDDPTPHPDSPHVTYGEIYARNSPWGSQHVRGPLDYNKDGVIDIGDLVAHQQAVYARAANRPKIIVGDEPVPEPSLPGGTVVEPSPAVSEPPSAAAKGFAAAIAAFFAYFIAKFLGKKGR